MQEFSLFSSISLSRVSRQLLLSSAVFFALIACGELPLLETSESTTEHLSKADEGKTGKRARGFLGLQL